ncbi:excalibur calcium-binding domain-containing protein [Nocardia concava]|uniref:excalibur calcium-binding domain-containing protein n=1 Tax=Nocardia concava TaxID=257281 RepID=UPI0002E40ACA|nr:excalibur calcium-binding domain-containing protein [Nocardia concava]
MHTVRHSLYLAALTACTLLAAACGSTSTSGPAPTTPKTTTATTTAAPTTTTATPTAAPTPTAVTSPPQPIQPLVPPPAAAPPTTTAVAAPPPAPQAPPAEPPTTKPTPSVYYKTCADAKRAGAAPLHRGDPGYRPDLDRDGDGIACEK